jgi:hypothetical protein
MTKSCVDAKVCFISDECTKERGPSKGSIFINMNMGELAAFKMELYKEPTQDVNRGFLAGCAKDPYMCSLGINDDKDSHEAPMRRDIPKSEVHMQQ